MVKAGVEGKSKSYGEGQNFDMAVHVFMMSGYGIKRVTVKEYQAEKEKEEE
ncbi:hypothetical protein [Domibacillus tundrae]|uniref:hypothetical protein n=1 Tax=Domibacillus tundrae TaxID=1587527 RepID=UPI003399EE9E